MADIEGHLKFDKGLTTPECQDLARNLANKVEGEVNVGTLQNNGSRWPKALIFKKYGERTAFLLMDFVSCGDSDKTYCEAILESPYHFESFGKGAIKLQDEVERAYLKSTR